MANTFMLGRKQLSAEEIVAREAARYEQQKEYHAKRNALITKLVAFYREYSGNCAELDEFMKQ